MLRSVVWSVAIAWAASAAAGEEPAVLERRDLDPAQPVALTLAPGATLEIKAMVGEIAIVRAKGDATTVSLTRDESPAAPRVEMLTHGEGVTLCTVYVSPNPKKPNECAPGKKGRLGEGVKKEAPAVRFRVEVPDGVHVVADLWMGNLTADAGRSDLRLKTLVGDVKITDHGSRVIQAETGARGNLEAVISPAAARPERRIVHLGVVMGDLRVSIPPSVPVYYWITTERAIETPFKLDASKPIRMGALGPAGEPVINLTLKASMLLGKLVLRPRSD